mgnify:CR=1 FL=1
MLERLKDEVCKANIELHKSGIVLYTWGNVSGIDREKGLVIIKPSGVEYDVMKPSDMVVVDLGDGHIVEGNLNPSTDLPTHLELYRRFPGIRGVAHSHSIHAVAFAQAGRSVPILGTTHADYSPFDIPCTRRLTREEVEQDYELNTGKVIAECLKEKALGADDIPGVLVHSHGPFTWGSDPMDAVRNMVILETISEMAYKTLQLNPDAVIDDYLVEKHYDRKHGKDAYYGQSGKE